MAWIECVPNISEGRDAAVVESVADAVRRVPGARLLHVDSDADHNRSVLTIAGSPFAIEQAAFRCVEAAHQHIDLTSHEGVHPRAGTADVVPFIPLEGATMEQCVRIARRVHERIESRLGLPAQLYGEACESGTSLPELRRQTRPQGSVAVGARGPLIAFNVQLDSDDEELACQIARSIRESNGGLPAVRALGFRLASRGCVQVSMNLIDWTVTTPARVYREIEQLASKAGVTVRGSELVGMIPQAALDACAREGLRLATTAVLQTTPPFLDALAVDSAAPGGGAAAAHVGAVAAALVAMGAGTARRHNDDEDLTAMHLEAERLRADLERWTEEDGHAFARYVDTNAIEDLEHATRIPLDIATSCVAVESLARRILDRAPGPVRVDVRGAVPFARAARVQAIATVEENLRLCGDTPFSRDVAARLATLRDA